MTALALVSDKDLLDRTPRLVLSERGCTADVIQHLMEIDRRRIFLDAACRSLSCYCITVGVALVGAAQHRGGAESQDRRGAPASQPRRSKRRSRIAD
jgi:hypothetical protein